MKNISSLEIKKDFLRSLSVSCGWNPEKFRSARTGADAVWIMQGWSVSGRR